MTHELQIDTKLWNEVVRICARNGRKQDILNTAATVLRVAASLWHGFVPSRDEQTVLAAAGGSTWQAAIPPAVTCGDVAMFTDDAFARLALHMLKETS